MMKAAAAAEYKANIGHDFTVADAYDADHLETDGEAEEDEAAEWQALNARMAEWYGIG
jgi:hypothetical protein